MQGHALVTGGSSGIGLATARLLAARGMDITLVARGAERLANAVAEIETLRVCSDQRFLTLTADVGDKAQAEACVKTAIECLGPPELLMTSAGIARSGYFAELSADVFEETMRINYFGTLYVIQAAAAAMRARRRGRIVMMSSAAGLIGVFGYSAYSPTKFALRGLAETLRAEFIGDGVGISIVYPPDTRTPQLDEENKTKPIETKRISATAAIWDADAVAKVIVRGIEAEKFSITPGWDIAVLNRFNAFINPILAWYFDRLALRKE